MKYWRGRPYTCRKPVAQRDQGMRMLINDEEDEEDDDDEEEDDDAADDGDDEHEDDEDDEDDEDENEEGEDEDENEDDDPLPAGNLLSGGLGGDQRWDRTWACQGGEGWRGALASNIDQLERLPRQQRTFCTRPIASLCGVTGLLYISLEPWQRM